MAIASLIGLSFLLVSAFTSYTIQPWHIISVVMGLLTSLNIIITGILGLYIGRIYGEVKKRPLYAIDEITTPCEALKCETVKCETSNQNIQPDSTDITEVNHQLNSGTSS